MLGCPGRRSSTPPRNAGRAPALHLPSPKIEREVNHLVARLSRRRQGHAGGGLPEQNPDPRARIDGLDIAHDLGADHRHCVALTPGPTPRHTRGAPPAKGCRRGYLRTAWRQRAIQRRAHALRHNGRYGQCALPLAAGFLPGVQQPCARFKPHARPEIFHFGW